VLGLTCNSVGRITQFFIAVFAVFFDLFFVTLIG
jgi:hypothetical protein